jgi:hypothetical protein
MAGAARAFRIGCCFGRLLIYTFGIILQVFTDRLLGHAKLFGDLLLRPLFVW